MARFLLVRHGQADWSLCDKYKLVGPSRDFAPLTELGREQIKQTSQDFRLKEATLLISSPYTRALETAAIISKHIGLDIRVEFDLHEWKPDAHGAMGSLEEIFEAARDYVACGGVHPEGDTKTWETRDSLQSRLLAVLERYEEDDVVIVATHEMAICSITNEVDIANGQIVEFEL